MGYERTLRYRANRTQGRRAVGGRLVVTRNHAEFTPNDFDAKRDGEAWAAQLSQIKAVGKMARTWNRTDGGLRARLQLTMEDGHNELFVVSKVDRVIAEVAAMVEDAHRSSERGFT